jgi:apolipoprotein N-acyltransferase
LRPSKVIAYQPAATPFASNIALAVFSGLLLVFAFPDWNLWSLGWVGTAPLIMGVVRERRFWRSVALGCTTGTIFYAGSSHWVTYSMHHYGGIPILASYLLLLVAAAAVGSFTGLFAGSLGLAVKKLGGWATLIAPVFWAASEYLRIVVTGLGWNALGYSQAFQPAVVQVSRWGGVYLVSAILVMTGTALVFAVIYLEQRRGVAVLTAAGLLAIASVLYGESLRPADDGPHSIDAVVVQPSIPIDGAWDNPTFVQEMLQRHLDLSQDAIKSQESISHQGAERRPVQLVIWPESPMNFEYDRDAELRRTLAEFTRRNNVYLLFNSWGYPNASTGASAVFNSTMLISPDGERVSEYDKIALMPFGEYVPGRGLIPFIDRIPALVADVKPGKQLVLADAAGARLGPSICFEITRPDLARQLRRAGASTLVQLSNESWFGPAAAPRQVLASAVFRAVENNIELIRAANSGSSAKIDRFGLVSGETSSFVQDTRVWRIQSVADASANPITFYTAHGDVFAVGCLIAGLLVIIVATARAYLVRDRS